MEVEEMLREWIGLIGLLLTEEEVKGSSIGKMDMSISV